MDHRQRAELGATVRRARRGSDWTQAQLAEQAGVAPGTVNSIENGRPARQGNVRAVLDALGLQPVPSAPVPADDDVALGLDITRQWLEGKQPGAERQAAVRELVRFCVLREWGDGATGGAESASSSRS